MSLEVGNKHGRTGTRLGMYLAIPVVPCDTGRKAIAQYNAIHFFQPPMVLVNAWRRSSAPTKWNTTLSQAMLGLTPRARASASWPSLNSGSTHVQGVLALLPQIPLISTTLEVSAWKTQLILQVPQSEAKSMNLAFGPYDCHRYGAPLTMFHPRMDATSETVITCDHPHVRSWHVLPDRFRDWLG